MTDIENEVVELKAHHSQTWRDKPQWFWAIALLEEVIELLMALIGFHRGPVKWELMQIAAIAMNWLEYLNDRH